MSDVFANCCDIDEFQLQCEATALCDNTIIRTSDEPRQTAGNSTLDHYITNASLSWCSIAKVVTLLGVRDVRTATTLKQSVFGEA